MLKSMTGFGRAIVESDTIIVTAEVKSLNSKFLDIFCRIPKNYSEREIEIRNLITQKLERGKVECILNITPKGDANAGTTVNQSLVKAYFKDLMATANELGFSSLYELNHTEVLRLALQMPNAYTTDTPNEDKQQEEWQQIKSAVERALAACDKFRLQEGKSLETVFVASIQQIGNHLADIEPLDIQRIPNVKERLRKNVKDLIADENFDSNRFEQELIYFVEKYDISEEKVRLNNHLTYFVETLKNTDSNGKKLNFIAQEIGREVNTIGSKANDTGIQRLVVQMKDELEKIKEQTANLV